MFGAKQQPIFGDDEQTTAHKHTNCDRFLAPPIGYILSVEAEANHYLDCTEQPIPAGLITKGLHEPGTFQLHSIEGI